MAITTSGPSADRYSSSTSSDHGSPPCRVATSSPHTASPASPLPRRRAPAGLFPPPPPRRGTGGALPAAAAEVDSDEAGVGTRHAALQRSIRRRWTASPL